MQGRAGCAESAGLAPAVAGDRNTQAGPAPPRAAARRGRAGAKVGPAQAAAARAPKLPLPGCPSRTGKLAPAGDTLQQS